jgi:hypothetical protein
MQSDKHSRARRALRALWRHLSEGAMYVGFTAAMVPLSALDGEHPFRRADRGDEPRPAVPDLSDRPDRLVRNADGDPLDQGGIR